MSTPQPNDQAPFLAPPDLPFLTNDPASLASTPRGSAAYPDSQNAGTSASNLNLNLNQSPLLAGASKEYAQESFAAPTTGRGVNAKKPLLKRPVFWLLAAAATVVVVLAVVLPVVFVVVKPNQNKSNNSGTSASGATGSGSGNGGNNTNSNPNSGGGKTNLVTGGDGSTVTKEDGSTFTYSNKFGGFCECVFFYLLSILSSRRCLSCPCLVLSISHILFATTPIVAVSLFRAIPLMHR